MNLILIGIILLLGLSSVSIYAFTQEELDDIQNRYEKTLVKIQVIINDIENQSQIILDKEKILELKIEIYEQIDAGKSWDAAVKKKQAKEDITNAEIALFGARNQLISLIETQEKFIIKAANYQKILAEEDIKVQPEIQNQTVTIPVQNQTEIIPFQNQTTIILQDKTSVKIKEFEPKLLEFSYDNTGLRNKIGVELAQSCIIAIKNNFKTECPTYEDLYYLDSSNIIISGKFVTTDDFFHREPTKIKNSWRWYDMDKSPRIFIDPPFGMNNRIKMITILPNFDTYHRQNDLLREYTGNSSSSMQEFDRVLYHDRFMNPNCSVATINADKWQILVNDTINYMQNNCNENYTEVDTIEIISTNKTKFDITTSQKYKDDQRMKWILEFCIFSYGVCKD